MSLEKSLVLKLQQIIILDTFYLPTHFLISENSFFITNVFQYNKLQRILNKRYYAIHFNVGMCFFQTIISHN